MNINEVSASDISTIPGISYEQARVIWQYRWQKEHINELSELAEIPQLGERQLRLIALYLRTE
jgi:DNA uptake protein ComE-like DNA-binding protein